MRSSTRSRLTLLVAATIGMSAALLPAATATAAAPFISAEQARLTEVISGEPQSIAIPSLGINIPVVPGVYSPDTATWTLNHATAQYATSTPKPNEATGNTFIYGHNNHLVFKYLPTIQPGALVAITTTNGNVFHYRFVDSVRVAPSDVSIVEYSSEPTLTIQTCVGKYYQTRQMFHFNFIGVTKET